jgi:tetratricopeptide (TPR) repeat protein
MAEKFLMQRYYAKAIPLYEKAVAIDPGFARAYNNLAMCYLHLDYKSEAERTLHKAFELSEGLPGIEKFMIQANYHNWQEQYDEAIEAYLKMLEIDPFESSGNNNLANVYARQGKWNQAIAKYEINVNNKDNVDYHSFFHLALLYGTIGQYDKAREIIDYYKSKSDIHSGETILLIHRFLAYDYIVRRKYDLALMELNKAIAANSSHPHIFWVRGDIYTYTGDLEKAEQEYEKMLENNDKLAHLYGYDRLAYLYLLEGKIKKSIDMTDQCHNIVNELGLKNWQMRSQQNLIERHIRLKNLDLAMNLCEQLQLAATTEKNNYFQFMAWYYTGLIYLEKGLPAEASRAGQELQKLIKEGMRIGRKEYYFHLNGLLDLNKNNNFDQAVNHFQKGYQLICHPYYSENYRTGVLHPFSYNSGTLHALFHDALAQAYYKKGDLELSAEAYEKIKQLTIGRLNHGDIHARSFYMLGKIYQRKGWEGKAIENYTHFINLWKDCDPEFQYMVADAREQIAVLGGNITL